MTGLKTIMPCFAPDKHQAEGILIGKLLAGYGELELELAMCVGSATNDQDEAIRAAFRIRGEDPRIKRTRAALKSPSKEAGLGSLTDRILNDVTWCKTIRNQYAHCTWYPKSGSGLGFVNLEEVALVEGQTGPLENYRRRIDVPLLTEQEEFFVYCRESLWFLAQEYKNWAKDQSQTLWSLPAKKKQPRLHY